MAFYRPAGQDFHFPFPVPELESFEATASQAPAFMPPAFPAETLLCHTSGLIAGRQCEVECWSAPPGQVLKIEGASDFYIAPGGQAIVRLNGAKAGVDASLSKLDREVMAGPALVLALAQRGRWCLHASAVTVNERATALLGESGQGKSTLASYLATHGHPDWLLAADDILPVTAGPSGVEAWPRFPQLKLPMKSQPGLIMPEHLPVGRICVLTPAGPDHEPELHLLPPGQAVRMMVRHTAGTRLFDSGLLAKHLAFCARVAEQVAVYHLLYPHSKEKLARVKDLLENLC